ncbi:apoptosis-inducing TAF9-like domain 1 family protein [Sporothrix brasiliensis 5110]|uniref:Apoptosis-inducing TAF9-like domain 1 family protein n=1 Tax=Sporothrix brasiliensis 5110 TaxID=1398154 RepID=A0A0C2FBC9_9PEZI|nr:apoptosis-inducing TAF9-like domain 1 family protein [Sporothrix brasiliensis 5110]KIH88388.1 apoptosis-inducing TAF9-like domain 1 family protein [Sporothrix brasiliensis 5110]
MANQDEQELKSALWSAVSDLVDQESIKQNRNATPQFIGALADMVWTQIESVAADLESFSRHAGRSTITTDDVLLLARRNEDLHDILKEQVDERKAARATTGNKSKKGKQRASRE